MSEAERVKAREECVQESLLAGAKDGLIALGVSSVAVLAANTFWAGFRQNLGISGKTALVVRLLRLSLQ
jgi:hypothetical protein